MDVPSLLAAPVRAEIKARLGPALGVSRFRDDPPDQPTVAGDLPRLIIGLAPGNAEAGESARGLRHRYAFTITLQAAKPASGTIQAAQEAAIATMIEELSSDIRFGTAGDEPMVTAWETSEGLVSTQEQYFECSVTFEVTVRQARYGNA